MSGVAIALLFALVFCALAIIVAALDYYHKPFVRDYLDYRFGVVFSKAGKSDGVATITKCALLSVAIIIVLTAIGAAIPIAVVVALVPPVVVAASTKSTTKKRRALFEEQLADMLPNASANLRTNMSPSDALAMASRFMPPPLKHEWYRVEKEQHADKALHDCIASLANRMDSEALKLVAYQLKVQYDDGGDLSQEFEQLSETIRSDLALKSHVEAITADNKMQMKMLAAFPFVAAFIVQIAQPELLQFYVDSPFGICCLLGLILFELLGIGLGLNIGRMDNK
ncbi:MAG: type II secretion system F family protein [Raoultibacter sp.]